MSAQHQNGNGNGEGRVLRIRGLRGWLEDESFVLRYGQAATIGRSRHCHISLKSARKYRDGEPGEIDEDERFLRVSREHVEISFPHPDMVEVRNLSRNGTRVEGKRIDRVVLTDLGEGTRVSFGAREVVELAWCREPSDSGSAHGTDDPN